MRSELHSWTSWEGGECPVPAHAYVDIKLRGGLVRENVVASRYQWGRAKMEPEGGERGWVFENGGDIVAYREVREEA